MGDDMRSARLRPADKRETNTSATAGDSAHDISLSAPGTKNCATSIETVAGGLRPDRVSNTGAIAAQDVEKSLLTNPLFELLCRAERSHAGPNPFGDRYL